MCFVCIHLDIILQVLGKVPTVSIDKTDGCMVYLSKDSINADIVTAKSSEMNILIPQESGDFVSFFGPLETLKVIHMFCGSTLLRLNIHDMT